jgi:hypothetical protein
MKNTPVNSPLRNWKLASGAALLGVCLTAVGCGTADLPPGQTQKGTPVPSGPFTLTVLTTDPTSGVSVTAAPADMNASGGGMSTLTLQYAAGTNVSLTVPSFAGANDLEIFNSWKGCTTSVGATCQLTMTSNLTVTAVYTPQVSFTLQPQDGGPNGCCTPPYEQQIGTTQTIYLHPTFLNNQTNGNVVWTVVSSDPKFDPGTIDANGNYTTPYPAPPSVTITATSTFDPIATVSAVINLSELLPIPGPTLTVDTSAVTHPISPLIYGINQFDSGTALQSVLPVPLDRWGGDAATRYNYLLDLTNSANDYYFETNPNSNTAFPDTSQVNTQIAQDAQYGATSMITVPLIGVTTQSPDSTKRAFACGYSVAKYGAQTSVDQYHPDCGTGTLSTARADGSTAINSNSSGPAQVTNINDTSVAIDQTFDSTWVNYLGTKFGTAANGGVKIYELDNEPEYWSGVHSDVHPAYMTYDELTNKGIAYATAIKTADPAAQVSGPVISGYINYFYSTLDQFKGYGGGNSGNNYCYCYNDDPVDYQAHGSVPLLAYYLQQMSAASTTAGTRLLDYLDLHGYYAGTTSNGLAFTTAGNTTTQQLREASVRNYYDSTYTGFGETDYKTLANANPQAVAVNLIPFMQALVAANYPGTKTAITEYNFGGLESISGAIAQAEALAVFGWQGLDMAALWGPPDPTKQLPGVLAFDFFLNYDGAGSKFGDGSLNATSGDTTLLNIYAAKRSSDGKITVLVFNKQYQDITSPITLTTSATTAREFQLTAADLTKITSLPAVTVTSGTTAGILFPAQSITLLEF